MRTVCEQQLLFPVRFRYLFIHHIVFNKLAVLIIEIEKIFRLWTADHQRPIYFIIINPFRIRFSRYIFHGIPRLRCFPQPNQKLLSVRQIDPALRAFRDTDLSFKKRGLLLPFFHKADTVVAAIRHDLIRQIQTASDLLFTK